MIYVPDIKNYKCFVVQNNETIRAYSEVPRLNSSIDYRDYYVNSHYLYKDGTQQFGNYSTNIPTCISTNELTDAYYYRNDFDSILIIFIILVGFCYFVLRKIIRSFFHGFRWC